jgi:glucosamine-6-phosphate deaminase
VTRVQLNWMDDAAELAEHAAQHVAAVLKDKPDAVIALPTGNTPLGLYRRLRRADELSCDRARFFNLDEFVGKAPDDPDSYGAFLWKHVFHPLGISAMQVRLLRGDTPDPAAECRSFDGAIAAARGLDLAILGLGTNGHVAFNEPGSAWDSPTREVVLSDATRLAQRGLYANKEAVPQRGLTMGLREIRAARAILLLVSGHGKGTAFGAFLRGRPDLEWPVTALLDHPRLTVLASRDLHPADAVRVRQLSE